MIFFVDFWHCAIRVGLSAYTLVYNQINDQNFGLPLFVSSQFTS